MCWRVSDWLLQHSKYQLTYQNQDPPTHLAILLTTSGIVHSLTATSCRLSSTHSVWGSYLRWTVLRGIQNVKIGYTSPASWSTTGEGLRNYWFLEKILYCIVNPVSHSLLICLRAARLAAISLQDLATIGDRVGDVDSQGSSWLYQDNKASYSYAEKIQPTWKGTRSVKTEVNLLIWLFRT